MNPLHAAVPHVLAHSNPDLIPVRADDRRSHPRFLLTLAITMEGENNFYAGLSENMSETGVFIATQTVLPIGTPVVLSFTLPNAVDPVSVAGTVQWLRGPDAMAKEGNNYNDASPEGKPGLGVRFDRLNHDAIVSIRTFMQLRHPDFFE